MLTLRQLLDRHPRLLLVDSCSPRTHALAWREGALAATAVIADEASRALTLAAGRALTTAGLRVVDLDAVIFCAGPGSVLGARLAAASARAWRVARPGLEIYSYLALPLLALGTDAVRTGLGVIADARRDTWHATLPDAPLALVRLANADLAARPRWLTPAGLRRWTVPPPDTQIEEIPYEVADLLAAARDQPLFTPAPEPEAHLSEAPAYAEWTPRVHQAPVAPSPR